MSREVRRVPVGYQHPHVFNPYWESHERFSKERDDSVVDKGIPRDHRFEPLFDGTSFKKDLEREEKDLSELKNKEGTHWDFSKGLYITGYFSKSLNKWREPRTHFEIDSDNWEDDDLVEIRGEDHLLELLVSQKDKEIEEMKHSATYRYTPVPDVDPDADGFGYCLYETVSEGTPVTPVFETADELVEYLVNFGNFWGEKYTRENAESLVDSGYSLGSFAVVNGQMYSSSTQDADIKKALENN